VAARLRGFLLCPDERTSRDRCRISVSGHELSSTAATFDGEFSIVRNSCASNAVLR
jgi:hypothetical protein